MVDVLLHLSPGLVAVGAMGQYCRDTLAFTLEGILAFLHHFSLYLLSLIHI